MRAWFFLLYTANERKIITQNELYFLKGTAHVLSKGCISEVSTMADPFVGVIFQQFRRSFSRVLVPLKYERSNNPGLSRGLRVRACKLKRNKQSQKEIILWYFLLSLFCRAILTLMHDAPISIMLCYVQH